MSDKTKSYLNPGERTLRVLQANHGWMIGRDILYRVNADGGEKISSDVMQNVLDGLRFLRRALVCYASLNDRDQLSRSYRFNQEMR